MTPQRARFLRALVIAAALGVLALAPTCAGAATAASAAPPAWNPIATVVASTSTFTAPCTGARLGTIGTRAPYGPGLMHLRILKTVTTELEDGTTTTCLLVRSPVRAGAKQFWIRDDHVRVVRSGWFVRIDLSERRLRVYNRGRLAGTWRVVVGAPSTPTPRGAFAIHGRTAPGVSEVGPNILAFAYSNVLEQFDGGPGRVAMHGRSGALLNDPLGTAASHGCVRMDNDKIAWLARRLPDGTPVDVVA